MAFPGELNINYYKGDTYEFKVYPQKTDGSVFQLSDYSNATFTIAESRGPSSETNAHIFGHASIDGSGTYITCAITPGNGLVMDSSKTYVYDVQIYTQGPGTYDKVYTLLTGSISVTDDVTQGLGSPNVSIPSYKVFYYNTGATDGEAPVDNNEYLPNQNVIVSNQGTLERVGYDFIGWTKTPNGTGNYYTAGDTHPLVSSDIKFYPKWEAKHYLVSFDSDGGTSVPSKTYHTDQPISAPTSPTKSGAVFAGWCETPEAVEIVTFPYTPGGIGNITLYAKWTEA